MSSAASNALIQTSAAVTLPDTSPGCNDAKNRALCLKGGIQLAGRHCIERRDILIVIAAN